WGAAPGAVRYPIPAAKRGRSALPELLVVDDHDAARRSHFVGMPAVRHVDGRKRAGMARVAHVHDGGAGGPVHVGDEQGCTLDPDLPAAWAVEVRHEGGIGLAWDEALRKWVGSSRPER